MGSHAVWRGSVTQSNLASGMAASVREAIVAELRRADRKKT
jgi:hypothetical protein